MTLNDIWSKLDRLHEYPELRSCYEILTKYRYVSNELTVTTNRDVILRQNWIVWPKVYQNLAIQLAHQEDMGIVNTKSLLQSKVYFPQMDNKVEELRRSILYQVVYPQKQPVNL